MTRIGYGRATADKTREQTVLDLVSAGVSEQDILVDHLDGTRPQWTLVRFSLRPGDTLVVRHLDQIVCSVPELLLVGAWLKSAGVDLFVSEQGINTANDSAFFAILETIAKLDPAATNTGGAQ